MNRRMVLAAVSALALLSLAACGSTTSDNDSGSGAWSFTDDRGEKISLDAEPKRIIAQSSLAAGLADIGVEVVGTFGPLKLPDGSPDPQSAGLDLDKVVDVTGGGEFGGLDLEKVTELKPDLIITNMYVPPELWYINEATATKLEKLAPIAAVDFKGDSLVESLEDVQKLGVALGADLDSAEVTKGREDFDAASKRLEGVGADLGDRQIAVVSASPELYYVADPAQFPDVAYYQSLGLPVIEAKPAKDSYWAELSWENADTYDADIAMWDNRMGEAQLKDMQTEPTFATIKAAKNDAYVPWAAVAPNSFAAYADVMNTLADDLEKQL